MFVKLIYIDEIAGTISYLGGIDNRNYRTGNFKRRNKCKRETI